MPSFPKILFFLFLLCAAAPAFAQDTKGEPVRYIYCDIVGSRRPFSTKVEISVDFGQQVKYFQDTRLRDEKTGALIVFNSMVDALNFMSEDGWEFVQAYIVVQQDSAPVSHYLMKKAVPVNAEE